MKSMNLGQGSNWSIGEAYQTIKQASAKGLLDDLEVVNGRIRVASLGHRLVTHFLDHFRSADAKQQRIADMHRSVLSQFLHCAKESLADSEHRQAFDLVMDGGSLAPEEIRNYKAQFEAGKIPDIQALDKLLNRIAVTIVNEDLVSTGKLQSLLSQIQPNQPTPDPKAKLHELQTIKEKLKLNLEEIHLRQQVVAEARQKLSEQVESMKSVDILQTPVDSYEPTLGALMRHKAQLASHLEGREQRAVNLLATIDLAEEVLKSEIATDEVNSSSESFDNVLYDEIPEDIDRSSRGAGEMTHVKRGDSGTHAVQALDPLEDMLPQPYETVVQQPSATVEVERSEAIYEQIPADMDRLNQVAGDFLKVEFKVGKHLSDLQKQLILINGCIAEGTVHHEAVSANANGIRNVILDRLEKMRQAANDRHTHKINAQQGLRAEECIALIREIDLTKARMLQLRSN